MNADVPDYEPQPLVQKTTKLFDDYSDEWDKKGNLLLKIQVCRSLAVDCHADSLLTLFPGKPMKAYNESRSFQCYLDSKKLDGPELISVIREKGVAGKGYFWDFMKRGETEITVITDPIHRAQPW